MALDRIYVTIEGAEAVLADFVAKPGQIARASRRAVRKVTRSAGAELARALADEHQLPLAVFGAAGGRGRRVRLAVRAGRHGKLTNVRAGFNVDDSVGTIWIGRNPVKAAYLGTPRQTPAGARAGKHFFDRAFVATLKSGHVGIFKRTGKSRLPIESQTVRLEHSESIIARIASGIPTRLSELLRQELNFEVNVKGRN